MPDQLSASRDPAVRHFRRNRVGVLDRDAGPGLGQLQRLFAIFRGGQKNVGGFLAIGVGHHGDTPTPKTWSVMAGLFPATHLAQPGEEGLAVTDRRRAERPFRSSNRRGRMAGPTPKATRCTFPPCERRAADRP